jgi:hypothetical protein
MISVPTVLILGAGASQPYGFPIGRDLLNQICVTPLHDEKFRDLLEECGAEVEQVEEFIDGLKHSGYGSVDAYLETKPQYANVGKLLISFHLIPCENGQLLFPPHQNRGSWYEYLLNKLEPGSQQFQDNQLRILTFNYDRSLEHYLYTVFKYRHGKKDEIAAELLAQIPIIHLHGSLGSYPVDQPGGREYVRTLDGHSLKVAAQSIRIVSDTEDSFEYFSTAVRWLNHAERIYFLGFGYNRESIRRLQIFGHPWTQEEKQSKKVMGTTWGIANRDWATIAHEYFNQNIQLHTMNHTVGSFLANHAYLD